VSAHPRRAAIAASLVGLAAVFLALHLRYLPASLEDVDSINFALGLHQFDVAHHRPHPPGYPVYIAIARVVRSIVDNDATALALLSVLCGAFGVIAAGWLARRLWRERSLWDVVAAALTMTAPLYWFTSDRPMSDAVGLAAAIAIQSATLGVTTVRGAVAVSAAAGLAIGVRSQIVWLVVPLLAWQLVRDQTGGHNVWRQARTKCLVGFAAGVAAWLIPLLWVTGGPLAYWRAVAEQGSEDLGGIRMLWTTPTLRELMDAAYFAFVAPWATWPTAAIVLTLAVIGAWIAARRDRTALWILALAFGPYLFFDAVFQETFTSRYALPLVVPVAWLAVNALRAWPAPIGVVTAIAIAMFHAHVGGRTIASYSRQPSPAFTMLADMRREETQTGVVPVVAPDRRQQFDLRRPLVSLGDEAPRFDRQFAAPPQHEWREAVKYWNGGGRLPVWFVVDPKRAAMPFVQHDAPAPYRSSLPYPILASGTRPADIDWYRVEDPEWYLDEGWSLTPEAAGVARADGRGLDRGAITGRVRSDVLDGGVVMFGGRNFDTSVRPLLTLSIGREWSSSVDVAPGPFVRIARLPRLATAASPEYVVVTASVTPAANIAIEQFDATPVDSRRGVIGFGPGWFEPELNPETGERWRWLGQRAELRYITGDAGSFALHIEGESPLVYYSKPSRVIVRAGDAVLVERTIADRFVLDVPVPSSLLPSTLVVETDQTHVPADSRWRRTQDRRRLGVRIFTCELRPVSGPDRAASSPPAR